MQDVVGQTPSERDEQIYAAWEGGKSLRTLAREFSTSVGEIERAIDRVLPPFNTQTQMRAYKREVQKLEDAGGFYHARAMQGDLDSAHVFARINERYCAMQGWSSVNVRLDPYQAQTEQQPSRHDRIRDAIMRIARGPNWRDLPPDDIDKRLGNRAALASPTADQNRANSEELATGTERERDKGPT